MYIMEEIERENKNFRIKFVDVFMAVNYGSK